MSERGMKRMKATTLASVVVGHSGKQHAHRLALQRCGPLRAFLISG